MSLSDPVGDMFSRIRNGQSAKLAYVESPSSRLRVNILDVLKREGYIRDYAEQKDKDYSKQLRIELKYFDGQPVIKEISRVSKPGRRVYSKINDLQKPYNGLGIFILSTPDGVMADKDARQANVGGEVVGRIY